VDRTLAVELITWIKNFFQFQTTLAYLKDPLPAYQPPAVDIMGSLDSFAIKAAAGQYQGEYDFEYDITNLVAKADDGHFIYSAFLIGSFNPNRHADLVSVSLDGTNLPKVYLLSTWSFPPHSSRPAKGMATEPPSLMLHTLNVLSCYS